MSGPCWLSVILHSPRRTEVSSVANPIGFQCIPTSDREVSPRAVHFWRDGESGGVGSGDQNRVRAARTQNRAPDGHACAPTIFPTFSPDLNRHQIAGHLARQPKVIAPVEESGAAAFARQGTARYFLGIRREPRASRKSVQPADSGKPAHNSFMSQFLLDQTTTIQQF